MEKSGDRLCVAICMLTLAYLLWQMAGAGWLF